MVRTDKKNSGVDWGLNSGWLLRYLYSQGVTPDEVEEPLGQILATDADAFLAIDDYLQLLEWGTSRLNAPHFGLDAASEFTIPDLGILGYLLKHSPTVGDFIQALERYQKIFMRGMSFSSRTSNHMLEVRWQIFRPPSEGVRQDIEFTLAAMVHIIRSRLGKEWVPQEVHFVHSAREPLGRYEKVFGPQVEFDEPGNYLVFDAAFCSTPLSDSDPTLLEILKQQADTLLHQVESSQDLPGQVRLIIAASLEQEGATVETVAGQLHMTSRTLHRRLNSLGTSYKILREDIVAEFSRQLLRESDVSITEIAGRMGYSESSAFVRAFKRSEGVTPLAFRKESR
jgi:AraC-like DNA-binding protein